jgi:dipeptidyl-peptidase 4
MRFGTIQGPSGDTLNWSMHLPPGFDPTKKWPVIVYVYGGPGVQVVQRNWGSNTDQLHAARGYIVFRIDNRGTPNRGRAFERAISRNLGGPEVEDQLAGLAFLKTQGFVDPERIGVWGWSYGGYMALRLATQAPTAFKAYVAGAPVTDWRLYDTHYTERFMGTPAADAGAYERASILPNLKNVKAPLLMLHGMADDNVTFDNSTAAYDALQAASIPFESMVYPGQKHGIRDKARAKHVQATILNFFDRTLGPGPR